jgi:hypothetical protein
VRALQTQPKTHDEGPKTKEPAPAPAARQGLHVSQVPVWTRLLGVQPQLTVNAPGDIYEEEADLVADQVMAMPDPAIQRKPG